MVFTRNLLESVLNPDETFVIIKRMKLVVGLGPTILTVRLQVLFVHGSRSGFGGSTYYL